MARLVGQTRRSGASWLLLVLAALIVFLLAYGLIFGHTLTRVLAHL